MKCGQLNCYREAATNQKYCSKECAPYARLEGGEDRSASGRMGRSSTRGAGDRSDLYSVDESTFSSGPRRGQKIPNFGHEPKLNVEKHMQEISMKAAASSANAGTDSHPNKNENVQPPVWTEEKIEKLREKYGENGMPETEKTTVVKNVLVVNNVNPQGGSTQQSTPLNEENSPSMSLIDDSAKHLFELMKSIRLDKEKPDPNAINAACNCAKNIRELMGLKLSAYKASKGS